MADATKNMTQDEVVTMLYRNKLERLLPQTYPIDDEEIMPEIEEEIVEHGHGCTAYLMPIYHTIPDRTLCDPLMSGIIELNSAKPSLSSHRMRQPSTSPLKSMLYLIRAWISLRVHYKWASKLHTIFHNLDDALGTALEALHGLFEDEAVRRNVEGHLVWIYLGHKGEVQELLMDLRRAVDDLLTMVRRIDEQIGDAAARRDVLNTLESLTGWPEFAHEAVNLADPQNVAHIETMQEFVLLEPTY